MIITDYMDRYYIKNIILFVFFFILLFFTSNSFGQRKICYKNFRCSLKDDVILKMINIYTQYEKHFDNKKFIYLLKYKKNKDTIYATITVGLDISSMLYNPPVCYLPTIDEVVFIQYKPAIKIVGNDTLWLKKIYSDVTSFMSFEDKILSFKRKSYKLLKEIVMEYDPSIVFYKIFNGKIILHKEVCCELFDYSFYPIMVD